MQQSRPRLEIDFCALVRFLLRIEKDYIRC